MGGPGEAEAANQSTRSECESVLTRRRLTRSKDVTPSPAAPSTNTTKGHSLTSRILDSQRIRSQAPNIPMVHMSHRAPPPPGSAAAGTSSTPAGLFGMTPIANPEIKYIAVVR